MVEVCEKTKSFTKAIQMLQMIQWITCWNKQTDS